MADFYSIDAKVMWKTTSGGTYAELENVRDVRRSQTKREVDVSTRSGGVHARVGGKMIDSSVEISVLYDEADAGFEALRAAFYASSLLFLQILDKTAGAGLEAEFEVTGFDIEEGLEDHLQATFTVKPGRAATDPAWLAGS